MKSFIFKPWKAAWIAGLEPGTRIMTRRPVKPQPPAGYSRACNCSGDRHLYKISEHHKPEDVLTLKPRYSPGNIVFVREAWRSMSMFDHLSPCELPADAPIHFDCAKIDGDRRPIGRPRVSIHLPERFARSYFKVVEVGAQRVQGISTDDAVMEGCLEIPFPSDPEKKNPSLRFVSIWNSMYSGTDLDWDRNPWVWVYTLEKLEGRP